MHTHALWCLSVLYPRFDTLKVAFVGNNFVQLHEVLQMVSVLQYMERELEKGFLEGHVVMGQGGRTLNCQKTVLCWILLRNSSL